MVDFQYKNKVSKIAIALETSYFYVINYGFLFFEKTCCQDCNIVRILFNAFEVINMAH